MLIGQYRLKKHFMDMIRKDKMPRFSILVGPKGQGKYTLAREIIGEMFNGDIYLPHNLKVNDIREMIEDSQSLSNQRLYILKDADEMTVQAQNAFLKFAEEPSRNAYIIMTVKHQDFLLPTIISRGVIFHLDNYTKEHLSQLTDNDFILKLCDNPGQIKNALKHDILTLKETVEKVIDNIDKISMANAFNIPRHFDDYDQDIVFQMFLFVLSERIAEDPRERYLNQIRVIYKYKNMMNNKSINKDNAMEMMFLELKT